jgi:hypothetical protein
MSHSSSLVLSLDMILLILVPFCRLRCHSVCISNIWYTSVIFCTLNTILHTQSIILHLYRIFSCVSDIFATIKIILQACTPFYKYCNHFANRCYVASISIILQAQIPFCMLGHHFVFLILFYIYIIPLLEALVIYITHQQYFASSGHNFTYISDILQVCNSIFLV